MDQHRHERAGLLHGEESTGAVGLSAAVRLVAGAARELLLFQEAVRAKGRGVGAEFVLVVMELADGHDGEISAPEEFSADFGVVFDFAEGQVSFRSSQGFVVDGFQLRAVVGEILHVELIVLNRALRFGTDGFVELVIEQYVGHHPKGKLLRVGIAPGKKKESF